MATSTVILIIGFVFLISLLASNYYTSEGSPEAVRGGWDWSSILKFPLSSSSKTGTTSATNDCCICRDIFGQSSCSNRDSCWWPLWCSGDCSCSGSTPNPTPQASCSSDCRDAGYRDGVCRSGTTCNSGETMNTYPGLCSNNQNCCCVISTTQTSSATQSISTCISVCNSMGYSSGTCSGSSICPSNYPVYIGNYQCTNNQNCCCRSVQTQTPSSNKCCCYGSGGGYTCTSSCYYDCSNMPCSTNSQCNPTATTTQSTSCDIECYNAGFLHGTCRTGNICYTGETEIGQGCSASQSCCCSGSTNPTTTPTSVDSYKIWCCRYGAGSTTCFNLVNCQQYGYTYVSGPYSDGAECYSHCGSTTSIPTQSSNPTSTYKIYCCKYPGGVSCYGVVNSCEESGYTTVGGPYSTIAQCDNACR